MSRIGTVAALLSLIFIGPCFGQDQQQGVKRKPRRNAKKGDVAVFPLGSIAGRAEVLAG